MLETDTSKSGLGAILSQEQDDGGLVHPIAYALKSLNVHEKKYSISNWKPFD